ncbi:hypothetical protein [Dactylosporangium sp. CA-139066]|uniref:hypothetical protein n=1 Tax=Dactylosporangium sp. CA-139066 TaxID=3239930 RepID=UPI003D8A7636
MPYWDPLPHVDAVFATLPPRMLRQSPEAVSRGDWEQRNWRNVPGPFYGAMTDSCEVGRMSAPRHVLYGGEEGWEWLYRQPGDLAELRAVLEAMRDDPWSGWARDGDEHWTPALVRGWWRDRPRLREWIARLGLQPCDDPRISSGASSAGSAPRSMLANATGNRASSDPPTVWYEVHRPPTHPVRYKSDKS